MNSLLFQNLHSASRPSPTAQIVPITQISGARCIRSRLPPVRVSFGSPSPPRLPPVRVSFGSPSPQRLPSLRLATNSRALHLQARASPGNRSGHNDQWESLKQHILEILLVCKKVYDMAADVFDIRTALTKPVPPPLLVKPAINIAMYWFEWLTSPKNLGVVDRGIFFEVDVETPKIYVIQTKFGSWCKTRTVSLTDEGRGKKFIPKLPVFDTVIYVQWKEKKSLKVVSVGSTRDGVVIKITYSGKINISDPLMAKSYGISKPTSFTCTALRVFSLASIGQVLASELEAEKLANAIEHLFNATMINIGTQICDSEVSIDAIHGSGAKVDYEALDSTDYE